jgi:hypothetical protein
MQSSQNGPTTGWKEYLIQLLKGLPWGSILVELLQQIFKLFTQPVSQGMYEVLEYESTLEILDGKGKRARFTKRQKVRYLQDNIIAFQDQAWGDGEILLNYRCSPGVPVDQYRLGHKTLILISLREAKQRGDLDEFHIEWGIVDGFTRQEEQWETEISHTSRKLKVTLLFPKKRLPKQVVLVESDIQKTQALESGQQRRLPDGRWQVSCEIQNPKLNERYILKWSW